MASIIKSANGTRQIQFRGGDGRRRTLRLGKVSQRHAEAVKVHVERLAASAFVGTATAVEDETARWVKRLDETLYGRLAAVGLVPKRERGTLGPFLAGYTKGRTDVKERTQDKYRVVSDSLIAYFGERTPLRDITPGDVDRWRLHLLSAPRHENTVRKYIATAAVFFHAAVRLRLIAESPVDGQSSATKSNPDREYFVTPAEAKKVLSACPDSEWSLIFALSRYGGLRTPSEHLELRWGDVCWSHEDPAEDTITIHSPKTEHHDGGETRIIPLFPELRPYLEAAFNQAEKELGRPPVSTDYVIRQSQNRVGSRNWRTKMRRIIERAGIPPWEKTFQNCRSSRETELAETYPLHVVCGWLGNSPKVAQKHYLQTTAEHFRRAATEGAGSALQKAVHHVPSNPVSLPSAARHENEKTPENTPFSGVCEDGLAAPVRLEQTADSSGNTLVLSCRAAQCEVTAARNDAALAAWLALSDEERQAVLSMLAACGK